MRIIATLATLALLIPTITAEEGGGNAPKAEGEGEGKGKGSQMGLFKKFDTNEDKVLSAEEIGAIEQAELKAKILKFDANADGAVDAAEFETGMKAGKAAHEKKEGEGEKKKEGEGDK